MGVLATRYRCAYPGCKKRYASTDGVRKHARKSHQSWIKNIDTLLETRRTVLEGAWPGLSKPSTYSIVESGNGMEQAAHSDANAEDAFKGSDGGLSSVTVTLEAESQVWCTCLKGSAPHSHLLAPLGSLGRSYASLE